MTEYPMRLITNADWETLELKHFPVVGCHLGKAYSYWAERNAYHGNPSVDGSGSIFFDLKEIHAAVEGKRTKGTHFRIFEHPAVVLRGTKHEVVLIDTHHQTPFSNASIEPPIGHRFAELAFPIVPALI